VRATTGQVTAGSERADPDVRHQRTGFYVPAYQATSNINSRAHDGDVSRNCPRRDFLCVRLFVAKQSRKRCERSRPEVWRLARLPGSPPECGQRLGHGVAGSCSNLV